MVSEAAMFATGRCKHETLAPLYEQVFALSYKAIERSNSISSKLEGVSRYTVAANKPQEFVGEVTTMGVSPQRQNHLQST